VVYQVKVWNFFLILGHKHRLRVFENMVLSVVFGLKWGEMTGGWIILNKEKSHIYSSPNIIWVIK
jgi:hypothetical protein